MRCIYFLYLHCFKFKTNAFFVVVYFCFVRLFSYDAPFSEYHRLKIFYYVKHHKMIRYQITCFTHSYELFSYFSPLFRDVIPTMVDPKKVDTNKRSKIKLSLGKKKAPMLKLMLGLYPITTAIR